MRSAFLGTVVGLIVATTPVSAQTAADSSQGHQDNAPEGERAEVVLTAVSEVPQDARDTRPREVVTRKRFSMPWQTGVFQ